jgi:integrase
MSRRDRGSDGVHFEHATGSPCRDRDRHRHCQGRWRGVVTASYDAQGRQIRHKVSGRSKTDVLDALKVLHRELDAGVRTPATYTVEQLMQDWLATLKDKSEKTQKNAKSDAQNIIKSLAPVKLKDLTARDVQAMLQELAENLSTRAVQLARAALIRAIDHAQFNDLVMRNVASLTKIPAGQVGRPSKSLTLQQARAVLAAAEPTRLNAYVVLSLLSGVRTEEARALRWADIDLDAGVIYVIRAERAGGDTKTRKSRRGLELPRLVVAALAAHKELQEAARAKAGQAWTETGAVFTSRVGTPLDAGNVRRQFKDITERAGLGRGWAPRELRHSFVSLMSDHGVTLEQIADLVGHSGTKTTELIYRHQLQPVIRAGAGIMDTIFTGKPGDDQAEAGSGE